MVEIELSDFYLTSTVNLGVESFMKGSIRLINAFESEKFNAESNDFIIKTSDKALKSLMNKSFYNKFSKYTAQTGDLFFKTFFSGSKNSWELKSKLNSKLGVLDSDIILNRLSKSNSWKYNADLIIENFQFEKFFNQKSILKANHIF